MRDLSFDICKGLLIMRVVIGHLMDGLLHDIVFLFNMPCFFYDNRNVDKLGMLLE